MSKKEITFNKISFFDLNYNQVIDKLKYGGLLVIPSGPGLSTLEKDKQYSNALENSDIAIFDSSYFCLLLKILKFINVKKFSGYLFLKKLLNDQTQKKKSFYLIDSSASEKSFNKKYLQSIGILKSKHYIAPFYNKKSINDNKLLLTLKKYKPKFIIINIGSGIQEPLGLYLKKKLNYNPIIICSGAAISFLTKSQANINDFWDKFYLGWFLRILNNPLVFIPRYFNSFNLFFLVLKSKIKIKNI
tara:strand:- start:1389 stop:2123 length:735 start_codon:yes stop_codon:yes gene_type:complete